MLESCDARLDIDSYLAWYRQHGADFLAIHGEERLLHYTGWPVIGQVTNLDVLTKVKEADLLEFEWIQVV
jgi:hypothetical protein